MMSFQDILSDKERENEHSCDKLLQMNRGGTDKQTLVFVKAGERAVSGLNEPRAEVH